MMNGKLISNNKYLKQGITPPALIQKASNCELFTHCLPV